MRSLNVTSSRASALLAVGSSLLGRAIPFLGFFVAAHALAPAELAVIATAIALTSGIGAMCASAGLLPTLLTANGVSGNAALRGARCSYALSCTAAVASLIAWPVVAAMFDLQGLVLFDVLALALALALSPAAALGPLALTALTNDVAAAASRVVRGAGFGLALVVAGLGDDVTLFLGVLVVTDGAATLILARALPRATATASSTGQVSLGRLALVPSAASLLINVSTLAAFSALVQTHDELSTTALAIAQRWELVLFFVPTSIAPWLLAKLVGARRAGVLRSTASSLAVPYFATVGIPALGVFAFADELVRSTSPNHSHAVFAVRVAALVALLKAGNSFTSQLALAAGRWRAWVLSDVLLAVALLVVSFPLAVTNGEAGLLGGAGIAYLASAVYLGLALRREPDHARWSWSVRRKELVSV